MYELALFAGAGGGILGTKHLLGWQTVCYVEKEKYPVEVIKARIRDGYLDDAPIWSDVRSFTKRNNQCRRFIRELRKIRRSLAVTAGFPCQPFSDAGKKLGADDPRNGWPHTIRIIREIRPCFVFLENVPGLISSGYIFTVIQDLVDSAYTVQPPLLLSASDVGANHKRERVWIVAHASSARQQTRNIDDVGDREQDTGIFIARGGNVAHTNGPTGQTERTASKTFCQSRQEQRFGRCGCLLSRDVADSVGHRLQGQQQAGATAGPVIGSGRGWWAVEPDVGRVVDRMASRVDRLRAIGNGQVPDVVALAWRILTGDDE